MMKIHLFGLGGFQFPEHSLDNRYGQFHFQNQFQALENGIEMDGKNVAGYGFADAQHIQQSTGPGTQSTGTGGAQKLC